MRYPKEAPASNVKKRKVWLSGEWFTDPFIENAYIENNDLSLAGDAFRHRSPFEPIH